MRDEGPLLYSSLGLSCSDATRKRLSVGLFPSFTQWYRCKTERSCRSIYLVACFACYNKLIAVYYMLYQLHFQEVCMCRDLLGYIGRDLVLLFQLSRLTGYFYDLNVFMSFEKLPSWQFTELFLQMPEDRSRHIGQGFPPKGLGQFQELEDRNLPMFD